ncbi:MAG TPA: sigma-70 family RNA polymerase sigma factor [Chthonomonadaceae bacterium]|nr:sigma-70 family RNA polymerase sigma factor [Chthonomonadaceae bacterium]
MSTSRCVTGAVWNPSYPPKRTVLSETDLWLFDRKALDREDLYAEFAPLVRRLIRQYGEDAEMRQDLKGEIYCRFCDLLDAYDPERGVPLRPYIVRQLSAGIYTYARQQWRLKRRETPLEVPEGHKEPVPALDPTPAWLSSLSQQMAAASLPQAMSKLPARQRKVVIWRYYQERSFEEIAQRLNVRTSTARSLLRHGLNNLRKQLARDGFEALRE